MAEHRGWCECPLLQFAAELERLARYGINAVAEGAPDSLVIAALRERYGCRGPGFDDMCPWGRQYPGIRLEADRDVPLLRRRPGPMDKAEERQYL